MKKGYIYSTLSAVLFGSAGLIIKSAFTEGADSVDLITLQYIIAVIIMFFSILITNKKALMINKKDLIRSVILGVIGNTFMTVFYYLAFSYLQVSMVAILLYTYPIIVFLYLVFFEGVKADFKKVAALILAFAGCFLSLGLTAEVVKISAVGIVFGILSAVFYAFMNIYSEKEMNHINPLTINFYSTFFSLISLIIYRFPIYLFEGELNLRLVTYTSLLAVICEIIPLTLLYAAIKHIGSLKVSIIGNLEIPTAMLLSYVFLNEPITLLQILGAAMVIYSVYIIESAI